MYKRIGITVLLSLFLISVMAQKKWNYVEVDTKSYTLFQQKKWDELIAFSAESRKQGIDFFYLQARTGIAFYNLKKYRVASEWFLRAWENDRSFEWLQEYLYYSLVFSGRSSEASKYAAKFTKPMQQKIGFVKNKPLRLAVEGGYSFNPNFDELTNGSLDQEAEVGDNYGEAYYLKNYHFESVDFSHRVLPGFNITHNLSFVTVNREQQIDWGRRNTFPVKTQQYQYFINPNFIVGKRIHISPSFNVVWGKSELFLGAERGANRYFYPSEINYSDFIFSTSVWSNFGNFITGAEINFASITNRNFNQYSAWITYYPFSNTNFYITPKIYFKSDAGNGFGYNTFGISGGAKLGPVYFYGQYLVGDMKNFIETAGYVIANFPGRSENKFMGTLYFPIGKKYQFLVRYINQNIFETYQVYTGGIPGNSVEYSYYKHTITGGISWNF